MESAKILFLSIAMSVLYGVAQDQCTARICIEYFTVFHPRILAHPSPTALGMVWGVLATWWVGALLGTILILAARAGSLPKLKASALFRPILAVLAATAVSATLFGSIGFFLSRKGVVGVPSRMILRLPYSAHDRFMADWWAHLASYATGLVGGITISVVAYRRRVRWDRSASEKRGIAAGARGLSA